MDRFSFDIRSVSFCFISCSSFISFSLMLQPSNLRTTAMLVLMFKAMEQSPYRETDCRLAGQETAHLLWNPKVRYHVHKSSPVNPILSWRNLVHAPLSKIDFNNILSCTHRSPIGLYFFQVFCMHGVCSTHKNCIHNFGWKAWMEQTTLKT
jgi:hypothetical protein